MICDLLEGLVGSFAIVSLLCAWVEIRAYRWGLGVAKELLAVRLGR